MNVTEESQSSVASGWKLESARLIAFSTEPPIFLDQRWLQELATREPEDFVSNRRKYFREDKGTLQGVVVTLTVDLNSVAWMVQTPPEPDEAGNLSTIGPFREKLDWFAELLSPWLAHQCPPVRRLAFVGKLVQNVVAHQEVYTILRNHLHLPKDLFEPTPPNDFSAQINRRRFSTVVADLGINRVSTWSRQNIGLSLESVPGKPFRWPDESYIALDLDINTAPEWAEILPPESLPRLFQELKSLGVEIAERGDVR